MAKLRLPPKITLHILSLLYFILHQLLQYNMSPQLVNLITTSSTFSSWKSEEKTSIVNCIFWFSPFWPIIGAHLTQTFGTKTVMLATTFLASLITIASPLTLSYDLYSLMAARVCIGFLLTMNIPAFYPLALQHIPIGKRDVFLSHIAATSLGFVIIWGLCRFSTPVVGWESVFYISGAVGIIWGLLWFYFFDEKQHICKKDVENTVFQEKYVPWKSVFRSGPIWVAIFGIISVVFTFWTIFHYSQNVLADKSTNLIVSGLPISAYLGTLLCCHLSACLQTKLTKPRNRKIFAFSSFFLTCILCTIQLFTISTKQTTIMTISLVYFCLGIGGGALIPNMMDLAPNYCGILFAIATTFTSTTPYLSTKLISFSEQNYFDSFNNKQIIFTVLLSINFIAGLVFIVFGTARDLFPSNKQGLDEKICLTQY